MTLEAETTSGRIRGVAIGGVAAFKGVPYGADTSGENRFKPPRKPAPWAGVRETMSYTGQSPQSRVGFSRRTELLNFASPPDTSPETEDCLTLNVWTPGLDPSARRPVMVWLHGGAFAFGSSNSARLEGVSLCTRNDVVLVTVNQRLNIFGFLDLSDLGGADYAHSGNAGALDMVAALEWVRDNIAHFGGDPGCVTIFGESGGGGKVSTLMAMPQARGLFHRAIVQSGAAVRLRERERALRLTEAVLRELGLDRSRLDELRRVPTARLLAAVEPATKAIGPTRSPLLDRYPFGPVVDGDTLPRHPADPDFTPLSADIPLIIGDTAHEATLFVAEDDRVWNDTLTEDELAVEIGKAAGARRGEALDTYRRLHPGASPARRMIATLTDRNFRLRSLLMGERKARQGAAPVWFYAFAHLSAAFGGRLGSPHAFDVPFTFNTIGTLNAEDQTREARALGAAMSSAWAAFARTGKPDHAELPHWPAYDLDRRATMVLDAAPRVEHDPGRETRLLWTSIAGG